MNKERTEAIIKAVMYPKISPPTTQTGDVTDTNHLVPGDVMVEVEVEVTTGDRVQMPSHQNHPSQPMLGTYPTKQYKEI